MSENGYEVVIDGDDGLTKNHAEYLRGVLIDDGFREDAVGVREIGEEREDE